ncbi:MAG: putative reverse transcriptase [Streblomastix strix]|uniref:Putative reverse transcriptase n=1 Tax=Streblomastix strix TaxID=222440 RepID=A0A5J4WBA6_9EUKA|nr:MAG: putative reverse transcriptase [Streblomastix strix]
MEKDSNNDADADSEWGSDPRRGITRGDLQINTSIINGMNQLGEQYHAPLPQILEYARQLEKEIKEGIVIQTNQIGIFKPTFLISKPGNNWRKILDGRQVNAVINLVQFKMKSFEFIKQILEKQKFATALDLEEAFHRIKVSSYLLPYFGFSFEGKLFTYSGLPFGYQNSPFHFNKVFLIAMRAIRQRRNVKISNYIDNMVLLHPDKNYLKHATQEVIAFLQNLVFKVQPKKCRLFPSKIFNYLGWVRNTENLELNMTLQRRRLMKNDIMCWINAALAHVTVRVRILAKLLEQMNFLRFQMQDASLIGNLLNHLKNQSVKKGGWNCFVSINVRVLGNLFLWFIKIKQNELRQIEQLTSLATLTADAAQEGWGSILQIQQNEMMEAGRWQKNQYLSNSNQREIAAVLMALRMHKQAIQQNYIHTLTLFTDSQKVENNLRRRRASPNQIHLVRIIFKLRSNRDSTGEEQVLGKLSTKITSRNPISSSNDKQ